MSVPFRSISIISARENVTPFSLCPPSVFVLSYLFPPSREPPFAPDPANPTPNELKGATADLPDEFIIALRLLVSILDSSFRALKLFVYASCCFARDLHDQCLSDAAFAKAQEKGKMPSARIDAIEEGSLPGLSAAALGLRAVELRLAAYPQSAESDETRLYGPAAETGLSRNVRNAMVVRLGEKRILMDVARVLRAVAQESECAKDGRNGAKKGKRAAQEEEGSRAGKKARG